MPSTVSKHLADRRVLVLRRFGVACVGGLCAIAAVAIPANTLSSADAQAASAINSHQPLRYAAAETRPQRRSTVVSTAAQLNAALTAARDGDRISLAPGHYGALSIRDRRFARSIMLASADQRSPATFSSIRIVRSQGVTIQAARVAFVPDEKTVQSDSAVFVKDSSVISLLSSQLVGGPAVSGMPESTPAGKLDRTGNVLGLPAARAITVSTSQDVELTGNDVSVFHMGVVLDRATGVVLAHNTIHDLRTTPLAGRLVSRVRIEGNHFHSFRPWRFGGAGDHGDLIHLYTTRGGTPSRDIIIRGNWLDQGRGSPLLGIYLDDNKLGIGFEDVTIEHNLVLNGNHQGIRLENVRGVVSHNTLVLPRGGEPKTAPQILALQNSNVLARKNIVAKITVYPESTVTDQDNLLVSPQGQGGARSYDAIFVEASATNPEPRHFGLRKPGTSPSVGADMSRVVVRRPILPSGAPSRKPSPK